MAQELVLFFSFGEPLDLPSTLESGQTFRWRPEDTSTRSRDGWYLGVVFNNAVKIRHIDGGIEFFSCPDDESVIRPLLVDYLRLEDDLTTIYASITVDERMANAVERYKGMRLCRQDPWECLVSFICSANSNIPRISANVRDICDNFGQPVSLGHFEAHTFPSPLVLWKAGEQSLRDLGLGFRARYVAAVSRMVANHEIDLFALRDAAYTDAFDSLTALPGVGDKIANCTMLFSLDKLESFPVDVWVRRALEEWYLAYLNVRPPKAQVRSWAQDHFGPYAGYASQYLFHSQRLERRSMT